MPTGDEKFVITLAGDVMMGRIVDQILPHHVDDPENRSHAERFKHMLPQLRNVSHKYPWGNMLKYFKKESDLNVINLETAVTTHPVKWPNKVFNYRMHPDNVESLKVAKIDYCSLANNHTLDFKEEGLGETLRTLEKAGITYAGCGQEAIRAHFLAKAGIRFAFLSGSDHPREWRECNFNFIDPENPDYEKLQSVIKEARDTTDFVIFSMHWGPNYSWLPDDSLQKLAHFFIDNGVDLIHGHSSHHIQGIEIYKSRPIIYGCGDFVDDYAVNRTFRNDLGLLHRLHYRRASNKLTLEQIELIPTHIHRMQVNRVTDPEDATWLSRTMERLCATFGTSVIESHQGNMIIKVA